MSFETDKLKAGISLLMVYLNEKKVLSDKEFNKINNIINYDRKQMLSKRRKNRWKT